MLPSPGVWAAPALSTYTANGFNPAQSPPPAVPFMAQPYYGMTTAPMIYPYPTGFPYLPQYPPVAVKTPETIAKASTSAKPTTPLPWYQNPAYVGGIVGSAVAATGIGLGVHHYQNKRKTESGQKLPELTLNDVKGLSGVKTEIRKMTSRMRQAIDAKEDKLPYYTLLLSGLPGNGKTLLGEAIAGELKVPFHYLSGADTDSVYRGTGAKRIREVFAQARKQKPCVIFIDEIDVFGKQRDMDGNGSNNANAFDQTISQLFTEMEGNGDNSGIIVVTATNRQKRLDTALTSRFMKHLHITIPMSVPDRMEILSAHLPQIPPGALTEKIGRITAGMSGRELRNLTVNAINAANERTKRITGNASNVTEADLTQAWLDIKSGSSVSLDASMKDYIEQVARQTVLGEGLMAYLMGMDIHALALNPRGETLQGAVEYDRRHFQGFNITRSQKLQQILETLAPRAVEELTLGNAKLSMANATAFSDAQQLAGTMIKNQLFPTETTKTILGRTKLSPKPTADQLVDEAYTLVKDIIRTAISQTGMSGAKAQAQAFTEPFMAKGPVLLDTAQIHGLYAERLGNRAVELRQRLAQFCLNPLQSNGKKAS